MIFERQIEETINKLLFKKRAILIFGPRQSGKTTLAKKLLNRYGKDEAYFSCEQNNVRAFFKLGEPDLLKELVGNNKIVVFDEAQTIQNIGAILKVFIDKYPDMQIITTGSSSFDLANKINEPLTGRSFEFTLYPLSIEEIRKKKNITKEELLKIMQYGMYPAVVAEEDEFVKRNLLTNITTNYLYKDVFIYESIKNPQIFENLIQALALQIGQIISVNELSKLVGASRGTVEKYLRLLEQSYIIKLVRPFSKNKRTELKKAQKVYFLDLGVRNSVINKIENPERQADKGNIFENFVFLELLKNNTNQSLNKNFFYWRTKEGLEVDFVETVGDQILAKEVKWSRQDMSFNKFLETYPQAATSQINFDTFL